MPKVGLKPCLPCAFRGGLWSFKPSAPAIKICPPGAPPKNYDEPFFLQYTRLKFMSQHFSHEKIYPTVIFWEFLTTMKPSKKFTESEKIGFPDVPPKKLRWAILFAIYTPQIHVPTLFLLENLCPSEFFGIFDDRKTLQKIYRERNNEHFGVVCDHLSRRRLKLFFFSGRRRCGTKSGFKTLSAMRVLGWFVII